MNLITAEHNRRVIRFTAASVAFITLIVFLPALQNDFVNWDDGIYSIENPDIRTLNPDLFQWAFSNLSANYWMPITWISHAVDYALWGQHPAGHHGTNILLHAANTFLVVILFIKLLNAARISALFSNPGTGKYSDGLSEQGVVLAAGFTGLLFGLHPLHVESVAWVAERKDLLYSLFCLLSLIVYARYAQGRQIGATEPGPMFPTDTWYILSLVFFFLSLASKPMGLTLPAVLLILDWYPFRRLSSRKDLSRVLREKAPFFLMSAVIMLVTVLAQKPAVTQMFIEPLPLGARVLVAFQSIILYLWQMVAPLGLSAFYPYAEHISIGHSEFLVPVVLVTVVTAACIYGAMRGRKAAAVVWAIYLVMLAPVLGIIKVGDHAMADRYTYLSSIGPFIMAGLLAAWIWAGTGALVTGRTVAKAGAIFTMLALALLLSIQTVRQISVWKNSLTLWDNVIAREPERVPLAYNNRGTAYHAQGRLDRALEDYTKAITLRPVSRVGSGGQGTISLNTMVSLAYTNRGRVYEDMGQVDRALDDFAAAIAVHPASAITYYNRGVLYMRREQYDRALEDFSQAIVLDPDYLLAYTNRGALFKRIGQIDRALENYTAAIELHPSFAVGYYNRGMVYADADLPDQAMADYSRAIDLDRGYAEAYTNRGLLFETQGQLDMALEDFNAAISANPSGAGAYNNRGLLFEMTDRLDLAEVDYSKAISLDPGNYVAYNNRGIVLGKLGRDDSALLDHGKAISIKPDFARAYLDRGHLYGRTGDRDRARRDYRKACELGYEDGCSALRSVGQVR